MRWPLLIKSGLVSSLPSDLDPHSLYLLANGVTAQDPTTALKLYSYAGDHDNIPALLKLAAWYEIGKEEAPQMIPVARNPQVSLYYHVKAAELGSNEACYIVMSACIHGTNGSEKSYVQALNWAEKALADPKLKNHSPKLFIAIHWQAGLVFMEGEHGLGTPQPQKAVEHWEQSGSLDHPHSLWNLGIFHLNGFGVIQDVEKGISLIKKGMALDSSLKMAPQLKDLSEEELEMAIEISKQSPANTSLIDVESLVKMAKIMTAAPKTAAPETAADAQGSPLAIAEEQPQEPVQMQEMDKVASEPSDASPKPKKRTKQAHLPNQFYLEEYLWIAIPAAVIGLYVVARSRQWF